MLSAVSVLLFLFFVFPVYWMVNTSFQPNNEIRGADVNFWPENFTLRNYATVLFDPGRTPFLPAAGNSIVITILTVIISLVFAFLAAIAVTRFRFKSRRTFIIAILVIQMIPGEAMIVSVFRVIDGWHLLNTIIGLTVVYIATVLPFTIWTLRGFVNGVPAELEEAAMIDGCSRAGAFWRVTFPLLAPGPHRHGRVRVHPGVERVHHGARAERASRDDDPAGVAAHLPRRERHDELGGDHGRLDPHGHPGHHLLPPRAGADDERSRERGRQGMTARHETGAGTDLHRDILTTLLPGFDGTEAPAWVLDRLEQGLGGVCLFGQNIADAAQVRALNATLRTANPLAVVAIDEEGGDVTRLFYDRGAPYPGNALLGRIDDPDLTERVARAVGEALAATGCTVAFAPDVDVNSDPDNPVIGVRSFGADPELAARHSAAWVRGLQSTGVAASAKHFPGHGDTSTDSHLALPVVDLPLETLRDRELVPFRAAIAAGTRTIMTSHILLPRLDAEQPATLSPRIVHGLLRGELGFEGVIVTDALDMQGASGVHGIPEAAVRALAAGCDLLCIGSDNTDAQLDAIVAAIGDAVESGRLPAARVREAAARVRALGAACAGDPVRRGRRARHRADALGRRARAHRRRVRGDGCRTRTPRGIRARRHRRARRHGREHRDRRRAVGAVRGRGRAGRLRRAPGSTTRRSSRSGPTGRSPSRRRCRGRCSSWARTCTGIRSPSPRSTRSARCATTS